MDASGFFLGTHHPNWLAEMAVPLCVSRRRLATRKSLPRAAAPWMLDSGGFTELTIHGQWTITPEDYADQARRYQREIGLLDYAAPQDWMCEPPILRHTGRTVALHQADTVRNFLDLRNRAPDIPWMPVLQGWTADDYLRCVDAYDSAGVELSRQRLVGVGTVCRRQQTAEAEAIIRRLAALGLRLHGFGLKLQGLTRLGDALASADSMAWSFHARKEGYPWCGSTTHINCANCPVFALHWRDRVVELLSRAQERPRQLTLWRKEPPMPDFDAATTTKARGKRGFRRVTMTLRTKEYEQLEALAETESRSPDQQAAYLLRKILNGEDARVSTNFHVDAEEPEEGES